jgi:TRAP-type transport system periplasmic protein
MLRLVLMIAFCAPLWASAMTLRISTLYPDGTTVVTALRAASDEIEKQTDGRVKLRIFPGGVMGDDRTVQRKISIGQLHGALAQGGAFSRYYRDSQILNLPIAFHSYDEVDYVRRELDPLIRQGFRDNGWVMFGPVDGGFAYIMSQRPVATVEALRQQKIWLPANDTGSEKAARVFGVSPIMLSVGTVLTSLQTGAIDAFAAPPVAALTLQWHSRVRHMSGVPLLYTYGMLAISDRYFSQLSKADQRIVEAVLGEAFAKMDRDSRRENLQAFQVIQQQGLSLVEPTDEQLAQWHSFADQATSQLLNEGEISEVMLGHLQRLLGEYRSGKTRE